MGLVASQAVALSAAARLQASIMRTSRVPVRLAPSGTRKQPVCPCAVQHDAAEELQPSPVGEES